VARQKIVIVGGGFGGLKAALELSQDDRFHVTLVSDDEHFRYYPALYHTATGGAGRVSEMPLTELLKGHSVAFVKARATHLDRDKKELLTKGAGAISYDSIIFGLGMVTNYFGIKGLEEFSYGIKSLKEAERFKQHLHDQLRNDKKPDGHYLIVGAGPTGVELAGVLPTYLKQIMKAHGVARRAIHVELIEAAPRVLPRMTKDVARATTKRLRQLGVTVRTNQKVESETAEALIINGQPVSSHTVVWTAGVACNSFFQANDFTMTDHHKVQVNEYLQAEHNVYVIGDNAETKYSGVAQTALRDAVFVADNLKRLASGKHPWVYRPKLPIYVTPTGHSWASVVWGKFRLYGRLGWWLREAADLIAYHDFQPWWPAAQRWAALHGSEESCPICGQVKGNP
jgi:NADH dehydrogenase